MKGSVVWERKFISRVFYYFENLRLSSKIVCKNSSIFLENSSFAILFGPHLFCETDSMKETWDAISTSNIPAPALTLKQCLSVKI